MDSQKVIQGLRARGLQFWLLDWWKRVAKKAAQRIIKTNIKTIFMIFPEYEVEQTWNKSHIKAAAQ